MGRSEWMDRPSDALNGNSGDCQLGYCGTCNDCAHTCHDPYRGREPHTYATGPVDWKATAEMWRERTERRGATPIALTGQVSREVADRIGVIEAVVTAMSAAGYTRRPDTLHVLYDAESTDDPMPWAAVFLAADKGGR